MSSDTTYLSISKFVGMVLDSYPRTMVIEALFEPERQVADKYKQFFAKPFGLVLRESSRDKPIVMKYETILGTFGNIVIKFTESKSRKINFRSTVQMLRIKTETKSFKTEDGKEIVYHPASISDASGHIAPRLLEMKNEYIAMAKHGLAQDDLDSII